MTRHLTLLLILVTLSIHAAEPPRVRLARSLSGAQIARIVTNAPASARISVPIVAMRAWQAGQPYAPGDVAARAGSIYVCVQGHRAQPDWTPSVTPALWRLIRAPSDGAIPNWRQPYSAHDAYAKGVKVTHAGKVWQSTIANNVWAPGVYGWTVVP